MTLLMNHVWLAGLLAMLVNLVIGRVRMRALVATGALTDREADRFCIRAAVVLAVVCGLLEAATLRTGVPPHCQLLLPITDRRLLPVHGLTLLCGAAFLFWVWKRGGDKTLSKVGPAFTRGAARDKNYTPERVRLGVTALLVIGWGGFVVMRIALPMPNSAEMPFCQALAAQPAAATNGASPH